MGVRVTERGKGYFEGDFSQYQGDLAYLFAPYTEEELETLFILLSRLYTGIDNLERKAGEKTPTGAKDKESDAT